MRDAVHVDEAGGVIDGRNRLQIAAELGLDTVHVQMHPGLDEETKRELALSLNFDRRHMTLEEQQAGRGKRIPEMAKDSANGMSTRAIAEKYNVSQSQVVADLRTAGEHPCSPETSTPNGKVVGKDGKTYSRSRKSKSKEEQPVGARQAAVAEAKVEPVKRLSVREAIATLADALGDLQGFSEPQRERGPGAWLVVSTNSAGVSFL